MTNFFDRWNASSFLQLFHRRNSTFCCSADYDIINDNSAHFYCETEFPLVPAHKFIDWFTFHYSEKVGLLNRGSWEANKMRNQKFFHNFGRGVARVDFFGVSMIILDYIYINGRVWSSFDWDISLTLWRLVSTKRSYILEQTCSCRFV